MNNMNRILIYGRLGKDPELKYTKKQEPVCYFAIAENIAGSEQAKWHKIVVWGKQAEHCNLYLKKGAPVFVQGQNSSKEFINKEGEKKQYTEVKADLVGFTFS